MGTALGRVLGGRAPGTLGRCTLCTGTPQGGGGGPKKRHLVLYKLAGFSPADRSRRGAFFSLHSSPLDFENLSKMVKIRPKMAIFAPKNPISGIFGPFFRPFFAEIRRGRGDPFFRGDPPRGGSRGSGQSPPFQGAPEERTGGSKKTRSFFTKKIPKIFF